MTSVSIRRLPALGDDIFDSLKIFFVFKLHLCALFTYQYKHVFMILIN